MKKNQNFRYIYMRAPWVWYCACQNAIIKNPCELEKFSVDINAIKIKL